MVKVLVPVPQLCSGCGLCVMACNVAHKTGLTPARSNLRLEKRCIDLDLVVVCTHGEGCELECIACGSCSKACPFHIIWYDEGDKAFKCDLCEGDPACVKYCKLEAIEYRDATWNDFEAIREHMEEVCE